MKPEPTIQPPPKDTEGMKLTLKLLQHVMKNNGKFYPDKFRAEYHASDSKDGSTDS